jgi:hypothetical protein
VKHAYVKISNSGSLNRKYLELIGFTTKRESVDDEAVIGNKGSGTKLAAVAALRLGLDVAIASTDSYGRYLLTFDVEDVDVGEGAMARQIFFRYLNFPPGGKPAKTVRYPSNMVIQAFQDWDRPIGQDGMASFKVLREFICNAIDADKQYRIDIVDRQEPVAPGETAVYIRYTEEIRQMLFVPEAAPKYFKFMGRQKAIVTVPGLGSMYPKSDPETSRLFVLGVLVDCSSASWRKSVFDYSMSAKSLISEERIIKNVYEYMNEIARLFGTLVHKHVMANLLEAAATGKADFEEDVLGRTRSFTEASKKAWLETVHGLFGENIAVASGNKVIDNDCEQIYGHKPVGGGRTDLKEFLKALGIPRAEDIVPTKLKYDPVSYFALDQGSRNRFRTAFALFAKHFPERAGMPIVLYHPLDEALRKLLGFTPMSGERKFQDIWLATKTPTSLGQVQEIFETLVHESRHCLTKVDDYDRAFVHQAERDVATVVFRGEGIASFDDGTPVPPHGAASGIEPNLVFPDETQEDPAAHQEVPSPSPPSSEDLDIDVMLDELLADINERASTKK